jgi:hypothetical protein
LDFGKGMRRQISAQSIIEYFVIMVVILGAILSTRFIERVRSSFEVYFNNAVEKMR